jgi:hypothetical protein
LTQALGALILLATVAGMVYVVFRPQWAVVLVLTLFPTKQLMQSYLPMFAAQSALFNFIIFGAVVLAVISRILKREEAFAGYFNPVLLLSLLLYLFAVSTMAYTPAFESALALFKGGWPYWLMMVVLLPLTIKSLDDFRSTFTGFLIVGSIICVLFFLNPDANFYSGRLTLDYGRVGGTEVRGSPLATASMGAQIAIVAMLMRPAKSAWSINIVRTAAVLIGLGLAVASGSRGNTVLAVVAAILFYPVSRPVKDIKQFFLTAFGLLIMAGAAFMAFRIFVRLDAQQSDRWDVTRWGSTVGERAEPAMRLLSEYASSPMHWFFGLGANAHSALVSRVHMDYVHNLLVETLCEFGLFGLTLLSAVILLVVRYARRLWSLCAHDPQRRAAVAVLCAMTLFLLLLQLKQGTLFGLPEPWWLWVVLTKIAVLELRAARQLQSWDYQYAHEDAAAGEYGEYVESGEYARYGDADEHQGPDGNLALEPR